MRIGIDGSCLSNRRGFGRFARQLLDALGKTRCDHEFTVFVDSPSAESVAMPPHFAQVVVPVRHAPSAAASATGRRSLRDMFAMGRAVARARLDLVFFPASYTFFPVWNVRRVVVTLHDALARAHPELVFPTWQGHLAWSVKEGAAVWQADCIATVSETARRDLIARFKLRPEQVHIISEGPGPEFRPVEPGPESDAALARYGITPGERYLLYVGGLSPHKNLPTLIHAQAQVAHVHRDVRLFLVGDLADKFHTHIPHLRAIVAAHGLDQRVRFTGFVPDNDLVHLYGRAYALVQPSLMEGFGLPPVEAMACGTPVVASTAGSLPEVIGEAGLFFDPTLVDELARALIQILTDAPLRAHLARKSLERAKRFSWSASAQAALDCFERLDPAHMERRETA